MIDVHVIFLNIQMKYPLKISFGYPMHLSHQYPEISKYIHFTSPLYPCISMIAMEIRAAGGVAAELRIIQRSSLPSLQLVKLWREPLQNVSPKALVPFILCLCLGVLFDVFTLNRNLSYLNFAVAWSSNPFELCCGLEFQPI